MDDTHRKPNSAMIFQGFISMIVWNQSARTCNYFGYFGKIIRMYLYGEIVIRWV